MGSAFPLEAEGIVTEPTFRITDLPERMQSKIQVVDDCWIWTGATNPKGYGSMSVSKNASALAHRVSYEATRGSIPAGLQIDHLCRHTSCVNPAHLEPVTNAENMRRRYAEQTHCAKGHPLSGENLRLSPKRDGSTRRACVTCQKSYYLAFKERRLIK